MTIEFRRIQEQAKGISTLAPFTTQCATLVDNGIGGGRFKWMALYDISREFRQTFH